MKINKYQRWICIIAALLIGSFWVLVGIAGGELEVVLVTWIGILMITVLLFIAVKDKNND